jgi:hypothetical protein
MLSLLYDNPAVLRGLTRYLRNRSLDVRPSSEGCSHGCHEEPNRRFRRQTATSTSRSQTQGRLPYATRYIPSVCNRALPFTRFATIVTCRSHPMSGAPRRTAQVLSTRRMNILTLPVMAATAGLVHQSGHAPKFADHSSHAALFGRGRTSCAIFFPSACRAVCKSKSFCKPSQKSALIPK